MAHSRVADHDLSMSNPESRPARDRRWEHVFWVDLDADATAFSTREALDDLGRRHDVGAGPGQLCAGRSRVAARPTRVHAIEVMPRFRAMV
jgi:hypothetical protein